MAMIKSGQAFEQAVVEVIDPATKCEKCEKPINLMESKDGVVTCHACGCENKIKDMN
jgi:hypothetical protein